MCKTRHIALSLVLAAVLFNSGFATTWIIKQAGGGDFTTIQAALTNADSNPGDIFEVQDNATYSENILFPTTNTLTLRAGTGFTPTIIPAGYVGAVTRWINLTGLNNTIRGFTINATTSALHADDSVIYGGGGTNNTNVDSCIVIGPQSATINLRGLHNVGNILNSTISGFRYGYLNDSTHTLNASNTTFRDNRFPASSTSASAVYITGGGGASATIDHCTFYNNYIGLNMNSSLGQCQVTFSDFRSSVNRHIFGQTISSSPGATFSDCSLTTAGSHGIVLQKNTATFNFNRCEYDWTGGGGSQMVLVYAGNTNFTDCVLRNPGSGNNCITTVNNATYSGPYTVTVDHSDLIGSAAGQYTVRNLDVDSTITVQNSIVTGPLGLQSIAGNGPIVARYNDVFCSTDPYNGVPLHPTDINVDPLYVETSNKLSPNYLKLRPTSPARTADEFGSYQGSKGVALMPAIALPSTLVDFGSAVVGSPFVTQNLTVQNQGTTALTLSGVAFFGAAGDFAIDSFPATIAAGSSDSIVVRYTPATLGPVSATVRISCDDPYTATTDFTVQGNGTGSAVDNWNLF